MLKQSFDIKAIEKVLTPNDVRKWNLWEKPDEKDSAIEALALKIKNKKFNISPLKEEVIRGKKTYQAANIEDVMVFRLLDRYIRRIYKVRQSDRNRIIRQIRVILKDTGRYKVLRLDIKKCYESMKLSKILSKLSTDMILSKSCLKLLQSILDYLNFIGENGIPRGLPISPTLAELYLEPIDRLLKNQEGVVYSVRYVDDFFILVDSNTESSIINKLKDELSYIGLSFNQRSDKKHIGDSTSAKFNFLGYNISVHSRSNKSNLVDITISDDKLNIIKKKISLSFNDNKNTPNFSLLKQRLHYLSVLKVIKKNDNGFLLGGILYNYQYVSDNFKCLKKIDGFLLYLIRSSRFSLNHSEKLLLSKISFYAAVKNNKIGKFTRKKAAKINRIWKDG